VNERKNRGKDDCAIVRLEQIYPLNGEKLKQLMAKYGTAKELIWVQEEPANMGAWSFLRPILRDLLPGSIHLSYAGRPRSASPAVGSHKVHDQEHAAIMSTVFNR
jgi:2-oxoglutarate dehydrogenase E1 component